MDQRPDALLSRQRQARRRPAHGEEPPAARCRGPLPFPEHGRSRPGALRSGIGLRPPFAGRARARRGVRRPTRRRAGPGAGAGHDARRPRAGGRSCDTLMKWLIVTGDDFGMTPGVNLGIVEAHRRGILTSASLMVDRPASEAGAALARECPVLSLGLHLLFSAAAPAGVYTQIERQVARFLELVGALPTHLDAH